MMKLGTENRNKTIAAASLGGLAVIFVVRALFFSGAPTPTNPAPVPVAAASATAPATTRRPTTTRNTKQTVGGKRIVVAPHSIDPSLRYDWLKASEDTKYEGNGRNIFSAQAEIPQPVASAVTDAQKKLEAQGPPPPPPPPPINLKFYGFASKPGEPKKVFLSQGEDVFIASEGEIVDRRYKVVHITPTAVEIEDVLSNNRQSIPLTQG
jgi:hypothetical protein